MAQHSTGYLHAESCYSSHITVTYHSVTIHTKIVCYLLDIWNFFIKSMVLQNEGQAVQEKQQLTGLNRILMQIRQSLFS